MENPTAPTSFPTTFEMPLTRESLVTINVLEGRIQRMMKDRVCSLEQQAHDAQRGGREAWAKVLRDEARVVDLFRHQITNITTSAFLEVLKAMDSQSTTVSEVREVELPRVPRRPYGRAEVSTAVVDVAAMPLTD